jgi:hypothetical protein
MGALSPATPLGRRGTMKVRALQTIKRGSRWHVPGTETEIFEITQKDLEKIGYAVEVLESTPVEVELPDDFPHRHLLIQNGIKTVGAVLKIDDLTELKGIGKKSAEAIEAYLGVSDA